jgi:hypothetical protein
MMRKIATIAALGFGLSAGAASAATVYAQEVTGFRDGGSASCSIAAISDNRDDLCNALGEEDHPGGNSEFGFLSAGNYDALKFTFGGPFTGPVDFFEITFGNANGPNPGWTESLDLVFLIAGSGGASFGDITLVADDVTGSVTNNDGTAMGSSTWKVTFDLTGGPFEELWVFDTSTGGPGAGGGFDIDAVRAVSVSPIPLPAAGLLLIAGLGGLALMRRRG